MLEQGKQLSSLEIANANRSHDIVNAMVDIVNATTDIVNVIADIANATIDIVNVMADIANATIDIANSSCILMIRDGMTLTVG